MLTFAATDVKNKFGQIIDQARKEPILVQSHGRNSVVILDHEEFERLSKLEDAYWGLRAMASAKSGFMTPEETMQQIQQRLTEAELDAVA